jgi:hypothetical protein
MTSDVRKGMPETQIDKEAFRKRFLQAFYDPAFDKAKPELDRAMELAWNAYEEGRKAPRTCLPVRFRRSHL